MKSIIIIAAILLMGETALAGVQWFPGDHDGWFEAVGGESNVTTIGFTEYPNNTTLTNHYADLGVTFEGLNVVEGPFPVDFHDSWGLAIFSGNHLYFDKPINWLGFDFLGLVTLELYIGDNLFHTTQIFGSPLDEVFGGVVSDVAFDHVRIFDPTDPLTVLDDLHFGPPIPTPATLAPLAIVITLRRRRRTR